jgi:hypothetical protein
VLDSARQELRRGTTVLSVEPQVFDLLAYVFQNRERVVNSDLRAAVWGGRIVSQSTLRTRINAVRTAIGDDGDHQRLIQVVVQWLPEMAGVLKLTRRWVDPMLWFQSAETSVHSPHLGWPTTLDRI